MPGPLGPPRSAAGRASIGRSACQHDGEHDPCCPAETTGEIVLTWGPDGPAVTAPDRAAVPVLELFGMRRVPGDPRAVELPGGIRYLIGAAHRRWRGAVHRMPH